jgi:hypothetical protein
MDINQCESFIVGPIAGGSSSFRVQQEHWLGIDKWEFLRLCGVQGMDADHWGPIWKLGKKYFKFCSCKIKKAAKFT